MVKTTSILILCWLCLACQLPQAPSESDSNAAENSWDKWAESNPSWVARVTPHRIVDNVYYVGSEGLGSYLIATEAGHVLLDGGLPQNAPMIIESVAELGFDIRDVRVLVNSHAHFDHSGGLAELKRASGAVLIAAEGDRSSLEGGFYLGSEDNLSYAAPKVQVDHVIDDQSTLTIGGSTLTANLTPGHSRGCTTWTMTAQENGRDYELLFFCSASVAGNRLEPPQYEGVVEDYRTTFAKTRRMRPDIPLSNHPNFYFKQLEKMKAIEAGSSSGVGVFVDTEQFALAMNKLEASFVKRLAQQRDYEAQVPGYRFDVANVDANDKFVFYLHGKIIEDQGVAAVSDRFGEYQYFDILKRLEREGFTVFSEPRSANTLPEPYSRGVADSIERLLEKGVPAGQVTIVGASKGAYMAALVSHYLQNSQVKTVLLAGCHERVVDQMLESRITLHGSVLAIRDRSDVHASGTCQKLFDVSEGLAETREIVLQTGLSHGLIYRPLDQWVRPLVDWANR